jgi:protein PsiE
LGLKLKKQNIREFNHKLLNLVENIGLLVIGVATVFAMGTEVLNMMRAMQVTLSDLLLLFLYLEVFAMVGLYYQSGKLPVRFPLYIAILFWI